MLEIIWKKKEMSIYMDDITLQQKFLEFMNNTEFPNSNVDIAADINELIDLENIHKCKFATMINIWCDCELSNNIDLSTFTKLKAIWLGNIYKYFIIPESINEIGFMRDFNLEINNLPSKLKKLDLSLCENFNQPLDNLPNGLKILILNEYYPNVLDYLPESLEELSFNCNKTYLHGFNNLPNNIKTLRISLNSLDQITKLPTELNKLTIFSKLNEANIRNRINYLKQTTSNLLDKISIFT
jgi:hypothetical protein